MKIALIGANGQLGSEMAAALTAHELHGFTRKTLDVTDSAAVRAALETLRPTHVINTTAFHRTDECEDRMEEAFRVNAFAVRHLAQVCRDVNAALVHFSTDYVFDGEKGSPYDEDDCPRPVNVYGASKLAGEHLVRLTWPKHFLVRTSGMFGLRGSIEKGGNFIDRIVARAKADEKIQVVTDVVFSPTYAKDLAEKVAALIATQRYGTYHIVNSGYVTWHQFATVALKGLGILAVVEPMLQAESKAKARRPRYSALATAKLTQEGFGAMRPWEEALTAYLAERRKGAGRG